jgi:DNA excision repair protein ERCC-2
MSVRYDSKTDTLRLSVTDLARERRAASAMLAGPQRSAMGRNVHIVHAETRASTIESYLPEQSVLLELTVDGGTVQLSGRIDGVWVDDEQTVLEEVKLRPLGTVELPLSGDVRQLLLYLWIWRETHPDEANPTGRLTYLDPLNGTVDEYKLDRSIHLLDELRVELEQRLTAILRYERAEAERLAERKQHANSIVWPYPDQRPLQAEMEEAVTSAITGKRHLLLEAPTGSGKTAPILLTAYRECVRNRWRLAYATSRISQQADRVAFIETAIPEPARGRVLLLGSQERIGAAPPGERREGDIDLFEAPEWFRSRLDDPRPITPSEVIELAAEHEIDPGTVQVAFAREADVLIGDINMFFGRGRRYPGWFDPSKYARPTVLLVDEAHNLPDRVRNQLAGRLKMSEIADVADHADFESQPWADELVGVLNNLAEELGKRVEDLAEREISHERIDPDDQDFLPALQRLMVLGPTMLAAGVSHEMRAKLRAMLNACSAAADPKAFAAYLEASNGTVHWELMDTAAVLRSVWTSCRSAVLFSATLSPLALTMKTAGLPPEHTDRLSLVTPVDPSHRLMIRYTGLRTTYRQREETLPTLCEILVNASRQTDGAWLVFFPSRAYLEQARAQLSYHPVSVTVLQAGLTSAMLRFLDRESGPRLHLAVLGGKYAEGFDPPKGLYAGAAVVSLGIPPPNARDELLTLFEAQEEETVISPYLVQGVRKVRQAGGRLFRSPDQAGLLLLIDHRFEQPAVEEMLGDDWLSSEIIADPEELQDRLIRWTQERGGNV